MSFSGVVPKFFGFFVGILRDAVKNLSLRVNKWWKRTFRGFKPSPSQDDSQSPQMKGLETGSMHWMHGTVDNE